MKFYLIYFFHCYIEEHSFSFKSGQPQKSGPHQTGLQLLKAKPMGTPALVAPDVKNLNLPRLEQDLPNSADSTEWWAKFHKK